MSGPFMGQEESREISEVNVVPLADVSLVLLIILLLLSPMLAQSSLRVKAAGQAAPSSAPAPEEAPLPPKPPELVLAVGLDERGLTLAGETFSDPGSFMGALKDALARRDDKKVFLAPGPDVPHGLVVHTLETIKTCGASAVALVQIQEAAPKPNGPLLPAQTAR